MSLSALTRSGGAEVRVCHTVPGPEGPYKACSLTQIPWPGILAAERDPAAFSLNIAALGKHPDPGPDLIRWAMIQYIAAGLVDTKAAGEVVKAGDAALKRLNAGLPPGFGTLDATVLTPVPPNLTPAAPPVAELSK